MAYRMICFDQTFKSLFFAVIKDTAMPTSLALQKEKPC